MIDAASASGPRTRSNVLDAVPNGAILEGKPPHPIKVDALHALSTRNVQPWQGPCVAEHVINHAEYVHARG